jgi:beta-glucanase (GH16 family)
MKHIKIMYLLFSILMFPFLSCGSNGGNGTDATPTNVNLTLTFDEISSYSTISGTVQISGTGMDGVTVEKGVCYSASDVTPTVNHKTAFITENNNTGSFAITLSGLNELTTYNARPYIKVHDNTFYGRTQSFKTLGSSPDYYPTDKKAEATGYESYTLVWADEFNIDGRPGSDWTYEQGFVRNEELQWYQADNAMVKDGCLLIEGRKESVTNPNYVAGSSDWKKKRAQAEYTSSCVTTRNSRTFMYGRFEIRAKIPVAQGAWPAIWLLGNTWEWPMNGEIDVLEYYIKNGVPSILANACWSSDLEWTAVWDESVTPFTYFTEKDAEWANKYHVWRMDWDKDYIRIYLDSKLLNEIDLSQTQNRGFGGNYENPFNTQQEGFGDYILLNLAIGNNGGIPDDSAFPLKYKVDYVRVYQGD